jgi:ribosomal-protein-alanine acetyltransferase
MSTRASSTRASSTRASSTRVATPADLDAIMVLERASFPTDAWSDAMMREELSSPHGWYVVVEEAGRLVGYAGLRAARGATDADIQTITIAEGGRGRGRGRALLQELLQEAARRGAGDVFLEVRADNPIAQALYVSEGFAELGRRPRYYQPDGVDAIVMKLDLPGWTAARRRRDQDISPAQDESGVNRPPPVKSPDLVTPDAARSDAGACT